MQNDDLTDKSRTLQNIKNLFSYMKMGREILAFGNIESEKKKFTTIRLLFLGEM